MHRWARWPKQQSSITVIRDRRKQTYVSISVCTKQTEVLPIPLSVCSKQMGIDIFRFPFAEF
jgi:hypothetical protein